MKQNILVVSYDFDVSKSVAEKLADFFSMRVLNQIDLFEFDYIPRSLREMIKIRGTEFVKKELNGLIKGASDFENVVLVADFSMADAGKENLLHLNQNYNIVYLFKSIEKEHQELLKKAFSPEEKQLFYHTPDELKEKQALLHDLSDVSIDITGLTAMDIFFKTVGAIKSIYNMN